MTVPATAHAGSGADDAPARLQAALDRWRDGRTGLQILEAGCGSTSRLDLGAHAHVVGLDISAAQLARNAVVHERIVGDVQSYPLPADAFDAAVCWDVLEHVDDPPAAVGNLARALRPGGVLVLAVPNLWSVKGVVTKLTPFWVHVAFYRHALGDHHVGTSAGDQFPTRLRSSIAPARLRALGIELGLRVRFEATYEGPVQAELRRRSRVADAAFRAIAVASATLSAGRCDLARTDHFLVLERPSEGEGGAPDMPPVLGRASAICGT